MRFLFDFISPYAYLAWTQIHALAARYQRKVVPTPVLFAGLLNAHGQSGPAEIPAKRLYLFKDAYRKARALGLPPPSLVPPPAHPFNPLLALRAASFPAPDEQQRRFIDELFAATWAGGSGVESDEAIGAIAERVGLSSPVVLAYAHSESAKTSLRLATEDAIARGVFGVPTVLIADKNDGDGDGDDTGASELFWGTDSLAALDDHLAGRDHIPAELLDRWRDLKPSATRTPRRPQAPSAPVK